MTERNKKIKKYLMRYRESIDRATETEQRLSELKAEAVRLKDHEGHSIALDAAVTRYVDACDAAAAYLNMLADMRKDITITIEKIKNQTLRKLIVERYINGKTWEQIAVDMNYCYRQITRMHGKALHDISDILNEENAETSNNVA